MSTEWIADVTVNAGDAYTFPEQTTLADRPNVALCFSGGGSRSTTATTGYLRGLHHIGLLEKARYISSVSGGTWATSIFTFYRAGPTSDAALLGPVTPPDQIRAADLAKPIPEGELLQVCTASLIATIPDHLHHDPTTEVWTRIVGEVVLRPFGLYASDYLTSITLDPNRAQLEGIELATPHDGRPFLVINACLLAPVALGNLTEENPVSLQFTPLYTGCPLRSTVKFTPHDGPPTYAEVGGGLIETVAWGGAAPASLLDSGPVSLPAPDPGPSLAFMVGASSAAFGGALNMVPVLEGLADLDPQALVWPVKHGAIPPATPWRLADGGVLENYGLLAMLQRGVARMIVFINTDTRINDKIDVTDPAPGDIDVSLPPLFGFHHPSYGRALQNNTVFPRDDFAEVVTPLLAARGRGEPLIAVTEHRVQANAWWGIQGGQRVQIAWVYLDRVQEWENQLGDRSVAQAIQKGNRAHLRRGPCTNFPNYKTAMQNGLHITELTPYQARLQADLTCWIITSQAKRFTNFVHGT